MSVYVLEAVGSPALTNTSSTQPYQKNRSKGRRNQMENPSGEFNSLCLKHGSNVTASGLREGGKTVLGIQSLTRDPRAYTA